MHTSQRAKESLPPFLKIQDLIGLQQMDVSTEVELAKHLLTKQLPTLKRFLLVLSISVKELPEINTKLPRVRLAKAKLTISSLLL
jgi:hypothetical protein